MKFAGHNREDRKTNEVEWANWLRRLRRTHVREFAVRLVDEIESRVGYPRPHVADVAEAALQAAGEDGLKKAEVREVILMLRDIWYYGPGLRNWAKRKHILKRTD